MSVTIYHNPRCSKSRATLALLEARDIDLQVVEYLKTPPGVDELTRILSLLGKSPAELMRKGEEEYSTYFKDKDLSDAETIALMVQYPKVIERPIVVNGNAAAVGRPPEAVLKIL